MTIPLQYNLRNLAARKSSTGLTILGMALVVWIFILAGGIVQNLRSNVLRSGDPDNLMILHKDASEIIASTVTRQDIAVLQTYPDLSIVSPESVFAVMEAEDVKTGQGFLMTHGIEPEKLPIHSSLRIVAGRPHTPHSFEMIISKSLAQDNKKLQIGAQARVGSNPWTIVGIFDASGTAWDGSLVMDRDVLATNFRLDRIQSVTAKLKNSADADRVIGAIADDRRMSLHAERETDYYARHTQTANSIQAMGMLISIIIAIGATFGAVNTLYAAVASRGREIGTLRALGFGRRAVLLSFIVEGVILSGAGGLLGCILGILSGGITIKLPEQAVGILTVHPMVTPPLLFIAFAFSVFMGVLGSIFPAASAARMEITQALRKI